MNDASDAQRWVCTFCGQDWPVWYRVRADGRRFLVCRECDAVWLPGDDRGAAPTHFLPDLFPVEHRYDAWDLIEPAP